MNITEFVQHIATLTRIEALTTIIERYNCKIGVEVGVREGFLSAALLQYSKLEKLYGIDINPCPMTGHIDSTFGDRYQFILNRSPECANSFPDNHFDFIYIDNDHSYEQVSKELPVWYQKLKIGGIGCGHDWMRYTHAQEGKFGVMEAVIEFCSRNNLNFYVTGCPSIDLSKMIEYGIWAGQEMYKYDERRISSIQDPPSWWLIKEKELSI